MVSGWDPTSAMVVIGCVYLWLETPSSHGRVSTEVVSLDHRADHCTESLMVGRSMRPLVVLWL